MTIPTITVRDLQRRQKEVLGHVVEMKQPTLIVNNDIPHVVILPVEEYKELVQLRRKDALNRIRDFAQKIAEEHLDHPLPSDIGTNHDKYIAEALEADLKRIHKQYDDHR